MAMSNHNSTASTLLEHALGSERCGPSIVATNDLMSDLRVVILASKILVLQLILPPIFPRVPFQMSKARVLLLFAIEQGALNPSSPIVFLCFAPVLKLYLLLLFLSPSTLQKHLSQSLYCQNALLDNYLHRCSSRRSARSGSMQSPPCRDPKTPSGSRDRKQDPLREIHTGQLDAI